MKQKLIPLLIAAHFLTSCGGSQSSSTTPEKTSEGIPGISLQIAQPMILEGQVAVVGASLSRALPSNTELIWEIVIGANRFTASSGSVIIPPGSNSAMISISTVDNVLYDGDTRAIIRVRDSSGGLAATETVVGIADNDPMPFVSIGDQEGVRGSRIDLVIELSAASNLETAIDWYTQNATATAGVDFVAASGTAYIPAGETRAIVSVVTLPLASDSNFTVKLSNARNAALADSSASAHILPGNNLNTKVSFAAASTEIVEGSGSASILLQLSNPIGIDVNVEVSAEGDAALGSDYSAFSNTVTIPAGATSALISVNLIDDQIFERPETLRLRMRSSTNASFGLQTSHNVNIEDNDQAPTLSVSDAQVVEGRALSFSVALDRVSGADTSFSFLTVDGNAGARDYTAIAGTVTIPKGQTVARVSVPTLSDSLYEENEYMTLSLSEAAGATLLRASARGTILDDDVAPTVQFSAAAQTVAPTQSLVDAQITLSTPSGAPTSIPFHVSGTGIEGLDHNLAPGVITIPAGQLSATVSFSIFRRGGKSVVITLEPASGVSLGSIVEHTVSF